MTLHLLRSPEFDLLQSMRAGIHIVALQSYHAMLCGSLTLSSCGDG